MTPDEKLRELDAEYRCNGWQTDRVAAVARAFAKWALEEAAERQEAWADSLDAMSPHEKGVTAALRHAARDNYRALAAQIGGDDGK